MAFHAFADAPDLMALPPAASVGSVTPSAVGELASATFLVGGATGHLISRLLRRRQATRDVLQGLAWAVGGKPQTDFSPAVPGLLQQVEVLSDRVASLDGWAQRHDEFHQRAENTPARKPEDYYRVEEGSP